MPKGENAKEKERIILFEDFFYVYRVEMTGTYCLCIRKTHYCISAVESLGRVVKVARKYIHRFRTKEGILSAIHKFSDGGYVPPIYKAMREESCQQGEHLVYQAVLNKACEVEEELIKAAIKQKAEKKKKHFLHAKAKAQTTEVQTPTKIREIKKPKKLFRLKH